MRDAYGRNLFGQGCLLARRLVEKGVPFIEVALTGVNGNGFGWDTHQNNFQQVKQLSAVLDPAWAMLMKDLDDRGMLDSTLIVWMGEFGRTPQINANNGRDHYNQAWSAVLAGGGIKGGQVVGATDPFGFAAVEDRVHVHDLHATILHQLGLDHEQLTYPHEGREHRLTDVSGRVVEKIV